uniref:Cytochrome b n=1 Tax=Schistosoma japonicum TaxID=6182 RepID=A0A0U3U6K2_SCHJA|nr:cytochrome b [Schistosoma japonicum]ALV85192.1 cytochrome b [Schistosoma japonicum]ALV85204.1 cytochrome b [Schistosoma japonicum]ALV85216.1 cytochrome b [Schistosoma japonicum]ALV85228.1 cytochrome b [Schistosoma japonicum]
MLNVIRLNLVDLPTSLSLNYFWCVGFVLSIFMVIQVVSGVVLSLFYDVLGNFSLLMMWTDDSIWCWFIRYTHIWCVSVVFFLIYAHMGRSLYYGSYRLLGVWNVGFLIYILVMIEAFLGYVLPWHQMSYWAATVLTSIVLSIPVIGASLYNYIIGGFSVTLVDTLVRVFPVHISLGFVLLGLIILHLFYLHLYGSSSPLFIYNNYSDCIYFHSYYSIKDLFVFMIVISLVNFMIMIDPNMILDVEAFVVANPLVTPESIKPEWYFLLFYAMLRSVDSKIGGLILVISFLVVLWLPTSNFSSIYVLDRQIFFWLMASLFFMLSYFGGCHAEYPYIYVSKVISFFMLVLLITYKVLWIIPLGVNSDYVIYQVW